MVGDPFIQTNPMSTNIFVLLDGHPSPATTIAMLDHKVREPAHTVKMVPALANKSLLSRGKFAGAGYVSVCNGEEVKIYDGHNAKIKMSEKSVLTGWRCPRTRLWRIPLQDQVTNLNLHILLLNGPTGKEYLKYLYNVP